MAHESNLSQTCRHDKFIIHIEICHIKGLLIPVSTYFLLQKFLPVFQWKAFENFPKHLHNIMLLSEEITKLEFNSVDKNKAFLSPMGCGPVIRKLMIEIWEVTVFKLNGKR